MNQLRLVYGEHSLTLREMRPKIHLLQGMEFCREFSLAKQLCKNDNLPERKI